MKWLLYGSFMLNCGTTLLSGATIESGDSSKRHKTDYVTNWDAGKTQVYTVSASASGCSFVDSKTKANGGATLKSHSSSGASAEKSIVHTDAPITSGFGFSVSGILAGSGDGSEVTWSATLQQKFFWLTVDKEILKEGTDVIITANGAPTESTWVINSTDWRDHTVADSKPYKVSSITMNRNMWDKMKWTSANPPAYFEAPTAGSYFISATTTEEASPRVASIQVSVVTITKPAKEGNPAKWLGKYWDCQAITSGAKGTYNLTINGNWAGRTDGEWDLSPKAGTVGKNKESSTIYEPSATKGSTTLGLKFNNKAIDTRDITIYEDFLEMGYENFGTGRPCSPSWTPLGKYGVQETDIPALGHWNCHGGTDFLIGNGGTGSSASPNLADYNLLASTTQPTSGATVALPTLARGDVITYHQSTGAIMHSQVVLSSTSTYSANNEQMASPGLPDQQSWKWAECAPGLWATNTIDHPAIRPITINVYRKK